MTFAASSGGAHRSLGKLPHARDKNQPIRATERLDCNKPAGSTVLFADYNSSRLPL
jgi:hypothetical protein